MLTEEEMRELELILSDRKDLMNHLKKDHELLKTFISNQKKHKDAQSCNWN